MATVGLQSRMPWEPRLPVSSGSGTWTPGALGSALFDAWDAEDAGAVTQSSGSVSEWRSFRGLQAQQATGANQPAYSATSFNGRPGITFNGTTNELTVTGVGTLPVGATEGEIIALLDQTALPADTTARYAFSYGGNAGAATNRAIRRAVSGGVNVVTGNVGNGTSGIITSAAPGDFSGRHVVRIRVSTTTGQADMDGAAGSATAVSGGPMTGSDFVRIGANTTTTAENHWSGVMSWVGVTAPLTNDQFALLLQYLKTRGGVA